jgi:hypothetical protein
LAALANGVLWHTHARLVVALTERFTAHHAALYGELGSTPPTIEH